MGCIKLLGKGGGSTGIRFSFVTPFFFMVLKKKKKEFPDLLTASVCAGECVLGVVRRDGPLGAEGLTEEPSEGRGG